MKNKRDVLNDLMCGKTKDCCGICKHFKLSDNKYSPSDDGICSLVNNKDESFCFCFEVCDDFEKDDAFLNEENLFNILNKNNIICNMNDNLDEQIKLLKEKIINEYGKDIDFSNLKIKLQIIK